MLCMLKHVGGVKGQNNLQGYKLEWHNKALLTPLHPLRLK